MSSVPASGKTIRVEHRPARMTLSEWLLDLGAREAAGRVEVLTRPEAEDDVARMRVRLQGEGASVTNADGSVAVARRNRAFTMRLHDAELTEARRLARKRGVDVSELIRALLREESERLLKLSRLSVHSSND